MYMYLLDILSSGLRLSSSSLSSFSASSGISVKNYYQVHEEVTSNYRKIKARTMVSDTMRAAMDFMHSILKRWGRRRLCFEDRMHLVFIITVQPMKIIRAMAHDIVGFAEKLCTMYQSVMVKHWCVT